MAALINLWIKKITGNCYDRAAILKNRRMFGNIRRTSVTRLQWCRAIFFFYIQGKACVGGRSVRLKSQIWRGRAGVIFHDNLGFFRSHIHIWRRGVGGGDFPQFTVQQKKTFRTPVHGSENKPFVPVRVRFKLLFRKKNQQCFLIFFSICQPILVIRNHI